MKTKNLNDCIDPRIYKKDFLTLNKILLNKEII